jgi:hypothetical protein
MGATRWCWRSRSAPPQQQPGDSVSAGFLAQNLVALFGRGARDVPHRFGAPQLDKQRLAWREPIQRKPSAHKGHRADFTSDVKFLVGCHDMPILGHEYIAQIDIVKRPIVG